MDTTIKFYYQFMFRAIEIHNVLRQWMLPSKFQVFQLSIPQLSPKYFLDLSHFLSKFFSTLLNNG